MLKRIMAIAALAVLVVVATTAYMYLKPTAAASEPIEAIPLVITTGESTTLEGLLDEATAEATVTESAVVTETTTADDVASTSATAYQIFEIVSEESEVRFVIDEVLNGSPKTVVGATDQVAGQLAVDAENASNTQIGAIQINARTFTTDSDMRNNAINNRILFTDDYEYITFTPTAITGLPETVTVGDTLSLQITGDLTIREVTLPVTFATEITVVSEDKLAGNASTTIRYVDFDISIPEVPSVTDVADEVSLEIDFVAVPV
jgi:polyisoprenoid-binding protein YceI